MQRELAIANDHRVTGVVATLITHDVIDTRTEQVGCFAFTFVAPLGPYEHDCRHARLLLRLTLGSAIALAAQGSGLLGEPTVN